MPTANSRSPLVPEDNDKLYKPKHQRLEPEGPKDLKDLPENPQQDFPAQQQHQQPRACKVDLDLHMGKQLDDGLEVAFEQLAISPKSPMSRAR
jgi:hypothetical protein